MSHRIGFFDQYYLAILPEACGSKTHSLLIRIHIFTKYNLKLLRDKIQCVNTLVIQVYQK